ncbi:LEM domain-containing protein 1 [Acomys russatus]|uniref:LEM domain-containing protein 1 n=1 Tax=Acomys russatus TaxID=60746 RepID=UPI0021E2D764|nr:LEM domain-containing protein 1 [Acomys russatus]
MDVQCLSNYELQRQLKKLGFTPGPILPSTRKMYEKKLVQLLASPPCDPPVKRRPRKPRRPEDSDDSEDPAVNIILKGNIKFSKDKDKECKNRPETFTNKRRIVDVYCLSQKPTKRVRHTARPSPRNKHRCVAKEDYSLGDEGPSSSVPCQNPGSSLPWRLKLAILGIFIIVLFVYITVEKKPLLA